MSKRVKVGDIEVGVMRNPLPEKTNWIVYRYRPRTNEYLSKQEAYTDVQAENLFTLVIGQEELRQKRAALAASAVMSEPDLAEVAHYQTHPFFARF